MGRAEGKVCIVTGAGSGLGAADARRLAEEGAHVVLTDVNGPAVEAVAAAIPGALALAHDVTDEARWAEVVAETMARFSRVDVLVNNAGLVKFASVEDCTLADFRLHHAVMAEGTFLGCKHVIPAMAQGGGGSIVNMASVAATKGVSTIVAYSAAKGAIVAMSRSIAIHCQEQGYHIRCNVLVPGAHDTPMTASALALLPADSAGLDQVRGHGQGRPEDVANLVLFLASDESRQITGTQIVIDNGETMG